MGEDGARRPRGRAGPRCSPPPAAVPDGDDELVADEQADLAGLDGVLLVDVPERLQHDEQRVGVALHLGPLMGGEGVLDGERVQVVEVGDRLELVAGRARGDPPRRSRRRPVASARTPARSWCRRRGRPVPRCGTARCRRSRPCRLGRRVRPLRSGMATVILARHGRTAANTGGVLAGRSKGVHLDETGQRPGQGGRRPARGLPLAAVVSSPLERCRETAKDRRPLGGGPSRTGGCSSATTASGPARSSSSSPRRGCGAPCRRSRPGPFPGGESMQEMSARGWRRP